MDKIKILEYNSPKGRIIYGIGNKPLLPMSSVNSTMVVSGIKVSMMDSVYHIVISYDEGVCTHEIYADVKDVEIYRRTDDRNYDFGINNVNPESYKPIKI